MPAGSGFTYQGQLIQSGNPATGQFDFRFTLYDDPSAGNQVGNPVELLNEPVTNVLFTVLLDFGNSAFLGDGRYLKIEVKVAGGGSYTTLTPRQALTPSPYAMSAQNALTAPWSGISGKPDFPPFDISTLDSAGPVGEYTSITKGTDGLGLISYYDSSSDDLKVAHCGSPFCVPFQRGR